MRQSLKIAISLLISVVLFSGFAVLAFTNLFTLIEAGFFQPRVRAEVLSRLESVAKAVGGYHDRNLERFSVVAGKPEARATLATKPSGEDIRALDAVVDLLQTQVASLINVRIVEAGKNLIHYSRLASDLRESTAERTAYKRLEEADGTVPLGELAKMTGEPAGALLIDGPRDRFIYAVPIGDGGAAALFYVDVLDLSRELLRVAASGVTKVSAFSDAGVLINASASERDGILAGLLAAIGGRSTADAPFDVPITVETRAGEAAPSGTEEYVVFVAAAPRAGGGSWGMVARLEPRAAFEMSLELKVLLLAVFFVTVFLVTYLLFNLRPDPLDVVSQRVKRFQVQLLESLLEREGSTDWGRWRGELERRRGELTRQVQRGIGRVSKRQRPEIDAFIDKGWNEILDLLERRAASAAAPAALDVSRLEALIQQALKSASFVVPAQIRGPQPVLPTARPAPPERGRPIQVEELKAEEVEDLQEAEPVEDIPEASLEEPVAEVEPLPEGEGASAAAPEPGSAAATAERLEEVTEAEEVFEAEEVAEVEPEGGVSAPPEIPAAAEEIADVELAADVEEIEELEAAGPEEGAAAVGESVPGMPAVLSIPVAETLGEVAPMPPRVTDREAHAPRTGGPARGLPGGRPAAAPAAAAPAGPTEETFLDALEELEAVVEITPLPPLPEEEGLEMLLPADEPEPEKRPAAAPGKGSAAPGRSGAPGTGESDDFEELEMLEEATEAGEEELSDDDQRKEIERLIASGGIRTWTIEQLRKAADEARSAIVVEDGVFRIKEEMYSTGPRGSGKLKRIADEVIGHEPAARTAGEGRMPAGESRVAPSGEPSGESGFSGIVDLMRDAEPLDLAKVVGADSEPAAAPTPAETGRSKVLQLKRNGLDYDEFLAAYPRSFSHTTQMKSLVEVSRRVAAISAALLLKKADGWSPDLAIGLGDRTLAGLQFRTGEPFGTLLLGKRLAVAIDRPPGELKMVRVRIDTEDLRYTKRLLLLPATFRGQEAYLLFAFAADSDIILENVLSSLQVQ